MNNKAEREAFEAWAVRNASSLGGYRPEKSVAALAFQGGAAYQRERDKGLVEALEDAIDYLNGPLNRIEHGSRLYSQMCEALAAYKAQEGK